LPPLLQRPPTSPPFPYTTLFRSRAALAVRQQRQLAPAGVVLKEAGAHRADYARHVRDDRRRGLEPAGARSLERDLPDRVALQHQDRKSTRLNSSHVKISYAVFCL